MKEIPAEQWVGWGENDGPLSYSAGMDRHDVGWFWRFSSNANNVFNSWRIEPKFNRAGSIPAF